MRTSTLIALGLAIAPLAARAQVAMPFRPGQPIPQGSLVVPRSVLRIAEQVTDGVDLTLAISGPGRVTVNGGFCVAHGTPPSAMCQRSVAKGAQAVLLTAPREGYEFQGWAGACAGQGARCFLKPTGPVTTAAIFGQPTAQPMVHIKVVIPVAGGKVGNDVFASSAINCDHQKAGYYGGTCDMSVPVGTSIALKATPEKGIQFTGWTSEQSGCKDQDCVFKASDPVTISASFFDPTSVKTLTVISHQAPGVGLLTTTDPDLKFSCLPNLTGEGDITPMMFKNGWTLVCTASVTTVTTVKLKAAIIAGMGAATEMPLRAKNWQGDCAGTAGDTCTLNMNASRTVIAVWDD